MFCCKVNYIKEPFASRTAVTYCMVILVWQVRISKGANGDLNEVWNEGWVLSQDELKTNTDTHWLNTNVPNGETCFVKQNIDFKTKNQLFIKWLAGFHYLILPKQCLEQCKSLVLENTSTNASILTGNERLATWSGSAPPSTLPHFSLWSWPHVGGYEGSRTHNIWLSLVTPTVISNRAAAFFGRRKKKGR